MDRKLDLLVGELEHYNVAMAGIQEIKWFGSDVWPAINGHTLLHSGRQLLVMIPTRVHNTSKYKLLMMILVGLLGGKV